VGCILDGDTDYMDIEVAHRVVYIKIDRVDDANALSSNVINELDESLVTIEENEDVRVIVVSGIGKHFSAGADIKEMYNMDSGWVMESDFTGSSRRLAESKKPVVSAVKGYVLGGGCELVEMSDIVIAEDDAKFGHPEITVGTVPGAGGTQRLPRTVGKHLAMDMLLTGRLITAEEAQAAGLVSRVVSKGQLDEKAREVATHIASLSPRVLRLMKEAVKEAYAVGLEPGLSFERRLFQLSFSLPDRREGMQAFLQKRAPDFG